MLKNSKQNINAPSWTLWHWITFLLLILAIMPVVATRTREKNVPAISRAPYPWLFLSQTCQTGDIFATLSIKFYKLVTNRYQEEVTATERTKLESALLSSCSVECLNKVFSAESPLKIYIVNESLMKETVGLDEFDGAFLIFENSIYLQSYLFETGKEEHLVTVLSNEISHALTRNVKTHIPLDDPYTIVAPWHNNDQKLKLITAYGKFLDRVENYRFLVNTFFNKLSNSQKSLRSKYDNAMLNYITPRHGKDSYNSNQLYFTVTDGKSKKKKINQYKDVNNTPPSAAAGRHVIVQYNVKNFFRELLYQDLMYSLSSESTPLYSGANDDQYYADKISDFAMLAPEIQHAFGAELCQVLNEIYDIKDNCSRPNWPYRLSSPT